MGTEYAKVLNHINFDKNSLAVVGRSQARCDSFSDAFNVSVTPGGLDSFADNVSIESAIVAVDHHNLFPVASELLQRGCKHVLVEKPGASTLSDLEKLHAMAISKRAAVYIAFNRRFLPSVQVASKLIKADGNLVSCSFEFTEMESRVIGDPTHCHPVDVLSRWGIFNSFHVIDLFFYLAGQPVEFRYFRGGGLPWHPSASTFAGAGKTDRSAYFSFIASWSGAGSWGIELTTNKRKLTLRPLEKLFCQQSGEFRSEEIMLEPEPANLKPGLLKEVTAFLSSRSSQADGRLCALADGIRHYKACERIMGYNT